MNYELPEHLASKVIGAQVKGIMNHDTSDLLPSLVHALNSVVITAIGNSYMSGGRL